MSILNRLGRKNRNTRHYQRNYEEVQLGDKGINIDMQSGDLVRGKQEEKESYYSTLRQKITIADKNKIKTIQSMSGTIYEVFSKVEEARIPLDYLVALDLVEEIDIESYQNIKSKGLEVGNTLTNDEVEEIDETLRMQVYGQVNKMPKLKDEISDKELGLVEKDQYVDEYQRMVNEMDCEEEQEDVENTQGKNTEAPEVENVLTEDEVQQEELIEEVIEERELEQEEEEVRDNPQINAFKSLAEKLRDKGKRAERRERQEREEQERQKIRNIREIYVIGKETLVPVIDGYRIVYVKDMKNVLEYTSSKRNLLVITQYIPKEMQGDLMKWLRGINEGSSRYRIATLRGSEVGHDLIEETVELTKESLDKYYTDFKDADYEGKDVEGFLDISDFLED